MSGFIKSSVVLLQHQNCISYELTVQAEGGVYRRGPHRNIHATVFRRSLEFATRSNRRQSLRLLDLLINLEQRKEDCSEKQIYLSSLMSRNRSVYISFITGFLSSQRVSPYFKRSYQIVWFFPAGLNRENKNLNESRFCRVQSRASEELLLGVNGSTDRSLDGCWQAQARECCSLWQSSVTDVSRLLNEIH